MICARGHCFDVAKSGYLNLLQPQERRSRQPGDTLAAVDARRRLHDLGVTQPLLSQIEKLTAPDASATVLDAGCGEGFYLGSMARETQCQGSGIDISTPAIDLAARRYPDCEWVVTNADRSIPYADASFSIVLSITARMNPREFRRVLKPKGRLLVALPAPDDLVELRGKGRERVERTVETFADYFRLAEQTQVTSIAELDAGAVEDVLLSIYRPLQSKAQVGMPVTFSLDLLLFDAS